MKRSINKRPRIVPEYFYFVVFAVFLFAYTVFMLFVSEDVYYAWINGLLTTMLSALAGFLTALFVYHLQVRRADDKRRRELTELVLGEIEDVRERLKDSTTNVPTEALEKIGTVKWAGINLTVYYPNSVLVQDAARSGLFDVEQTRAMMLLVQDMDNHVRFVEHSSQLEPALEEAMAGALSRGNPKASRWARGMLRRYAQSVRMVQLSEESIVGRCGDVFEALNEKNGGSSGPR